MACPDPCTHGDQKIEMQIWSKRLGTSSRRQSSTVYGWKSPVARPDQPHCKGEAPALSGGNADVVLCHPADVSGTLYEAVPNGKHEGLCMLSHDARVQYKDLPLGK